MKKTPEEVLDFLKSPERFVPCLPGLVRYSVGEGAARVRLRLRVEGAGIADMTSITSEATIRVVARGGDSVEYVVKGRVAGSDYSISLLAGVERVGEGSRVSWEARVSLGKLLQLLGGFVDMDRLASTIAEEAVRSLAGCLDGLRG